MTHTNRQFTGLKKYYAILLIVVLFVFQITPVFSVYADETAPDVATDDVITEVQTESTPQDDKLDLLDQILQDPIEFARQEFERKQAEEAAEEARLEEERLEQERLEQERLEQEQREAEETAAQESNEETTSEESSSNETEGDDQGQEDTSNTEGSNGESSENTSEDNSNEDSSESSNSSEEVSNENEEPEAPEAPEAPSAPSTSNGSTNDSPAPTAPPTSGGGGGGFGGILSDIISNIPTSLEEAVDLVEDQRSRYDERDVRTDDVTGDSETESTDLTEDDGGTDGEGAEAQGDGAEAQGDAQTDVTGSDDTTVNNISESEDGAVIETDNTLAQENVTNGAASSGGNSIESEGDVTKVKLETGSAEIASNGEVKGNTTDISTGGGSSGGGGGGWIQRIYGDAGAGNAATDTRNADLKAIAGDVQELTLINKNKAFVSNIKDLLALTGQNSIDASRRCKECEIKTGDAIAKSSLLNIINTNTVDSAFLPITIDIFDSFDGNINVLELLFEAFGDALEGPGAVTATAVNSDTDTDDTSSTAIASASDTLTVVNDNEGYIFNDLDLTTITGQNRINAYQKVKDVLINTGDADVTNTLVNFLNTTLFKSKIGVVVLNVYGDWNGSLIVPDALRLAGAVPDPSGVVSTENNTLVADGDDTLNSALAIVNSDLEYLSDSVGGVETTINVNANTGVNQAVFEKDGENIKKTNGEITALSNVLTLANRDILGTSFSHAFVNTLGDWTGNVIGAGDARIEGNDKNFVVASESSAFTEGHGVVAAESNNSATDVDDNVQNAITEVSKSVKVNNIDTGFVVNDLTINTDTGNNDIIAYKGTDVEIQTGDSLIGNNVATFMNNNFAYSKGVMVVLNTFKDWNGNLAYDELFDLASDVELLTAPHALLPGEEVQYEVSALNVGTEEAAPETLDFTFDPQQLELLDADGGSVSGNTITWPVGTLRGGERVTRNPNFRLRTSIEPGEHVLEGVSRISTSDDNSRNNTAADTLRYNLDDDQTVSEVPNTDTNNDNTNTENTNEATDTPQDNAPEENANDDAAESEETNQNNQPANNNSNDSGDNAPPPAVINGFTPGYLIIEKQVDGSGFGFGDEVDYLVDITNPGDTMIRDVVVYDEFGNGEFSNIESWEIGNINIGETVTIGYHITVTEELEPGTYTNTVYASGFDSAHAVIRSQLASATITVENDQFVAPQTNPSTTGGGGAAPTVISGETDEATDNDASEETEEAVALTSETEESTDDFGVITSFGNGVEAPTNEGGSGQLASSSELSEEALESIKENIHVEITESATINRTFNGQGRVARAAEIPEAVQEQILGTTSQVLGASDTADSADRLAYAVYPNFLHFDGMPEQEASPSSFGFINVLTNKLYWIFLVLVLITGYVSYKEKQRRIRNNY